MHEGALHQSSRGLFRSAVVSNVPLCREHYRLTLRVDEFPPTLPGQFVQVACNDDPTNFDAAEIEWAEPGNATATTGMPRLTGAEILGRTPVLRRPFSLAGRRDFVDGSVELDLIHRIVGAGTEWLSKLEPAQEVNLVGPLGNSFPLPPTGSTALLIGGGVGIPPMIYLASRLATTGHTAVAFAGALTRDLMSLTLEVDSKGDTVASEFDRHGFKAILSTDDGSLGYRGYVTQALEQWLDANDKPGGSTPPPTLYTCGPEPMMKRVADIAQTRGLTAHIAVERAMACGMGTCQSCVIKLRDTTSPSPDAWRYRLACTDGPVFTATDLRW